MHFAQRTIIYNLLPDCGPLSIQFIYKTKKENQTWVWYGSCLVMKQKHVLGWWPWKWVTVPFYTCCSICSLPVKSCVSFSPLLLQFHCFTMCDENKTWHLSNKTVECGYLQPAYLVEEATWLAALEFTLHTFCINGSRDFQDLHKTGRNKQRECFLFATKQVCAEAEQL